MSISKKISLAILACFTCIIGNSQCRQLVWNDEFDVDGAPDKLKWGFDIGGHGWGNGEAQYYASSLKNAFVEDGKLIIKAIKEQNAGNDYTSARLVSKGKGDWKYGTIEVRAKLPEGRGTWPAIWMLPTDNVYGGWPNSGEIDIMEHVGYQQNKIHGTVHTGHFNHLKGTQKGGSINQKGVSKEFHVYSINWFENKIDFYLDGNKYFTFNNEDNSSSKWPFDQYFHLVMNIAIGGSWGGVQGIDNSIFPQQMEIDYVRVYEFTNSPTILGAEIASPNDELEFSTTVYGKSFLWNVPSDAIIISGQGTNSVTVKWGNDSGSVSVIFYGDTSCNGKFISKRIKLKTSGVETFSHEKTQVYYSNSKLSISSESPIVDVKVYGINGDLISHFKQYSQPISIGLKPGIYLVKMKSENQFFTQKLIVNE
ncbi:MAG: family 16 glycosylhydrolase [Bacteroidetes bacterium]|nr:family 16 glycosylhydrolase [Bacteroidota bacterium]